MPAEKSKNENTPGTLSVLFGIVALLSIVGIASPIVGLISLLSAIAAVVFGAIGIRRNKRDTKSWVGLIMGGVYLVAGLIVLIMVDFGNK